MKNNKPTSQLTPLQKLTQFMQSVPAEQEQKWRLIARNMPANQRFDVEKALGAYEYNLQKLSAPAKSNPELLHQGDFDQSPTLGNLRKYRGEDVKAYLEDFIDVALISFDTGQRPNEKAIEILINDILTTYYWMTIEEMKTFWYQLRQGLLGNTFNNLSAATILAKLLEYSAQCMNAREQVALEQHTKRARADRKAYTRK